MQDDHRPPCTYVSESEEDQELLENLEALDPCGDYEDVEFSNRVKNFLEKYEKEIDKEACTPQDWESAPSSSTNQAETSGEPRATGRIMKSTEFSDQNSGVAIKSWSDLRMLLRESNLH